MTEWCLQHPWMIFFILVFTVWLLIQKTFGLFEGKKKFMENLSAKGGMYMPDEKNSGNSNNGGNNKPDSRSRVFHKDRGSQRVKPTSAPPPSAPPRQK
jgi:hypothetical protein